MLIFVWTAVNTAMYDKCFSAVIVILPEDTATQGDQPILNVFVSFSCREIAEFCSKYKLALN